MATFKRAHKRCLLGHQVYGVVLEQARATGHDQVCFVGMYDKGENAITTTTIDCMSGKQNVTYGQISESSVESKKGPPSHTV